MKQKKLVMTDAATLSPLGVGYQSFKQALLQEKTAFAPIQLFNTTETQQFIGGEVWNFDPKEILGRKGLRVLDRNTCFVLACIQHDLGYLFETIPPETIGLVIGTNFGSLPSLERFTKTYLQEGFRALNPRHFPNLVINSPPSQGNIRFGITGSSTTLANGITSGLDSILFAANSIQQGLGEIFLCGASEELSHSLCFVMQQEHQLADTDEVAPFAEPSSGTLPSEGTALFILETSEHAKTRQAKPIVEVASWSNAHVGGWTNHLVPSAKAGKWVIQETLREAKISPQELDFISVSANGWCKNDQAVLQALQQAIPPEILKNIPISAPASYWGDAGATSSAFQLAAALASIQTGKLFGNRIQAEQKKPECLKIPKAHVIKNFHYGLILSIGNTGTASAILLKSFSESDKIDRSDRNETCTNPFR